MFNSPETQLALVKALNKEKKWGFTDAHFKKVERLPIQPTEELTTTVLVPYFSTLQKTFDTLWEAIEDPEGFTKWRWEELKSDPKHLRLHKGKHPKKQLKWVTLDFKANWDKNSGISPKDVRKKDDSLAGVEVLAAALLNPEYVKAMDGETVPYADMANLEFRYNEAWSSCPFLDRWAGDRRLRLRACWAGVAAPEWAAPRVLSAEFESLETRPLVEAGPLELGDEITINGRTFVPKEKLDEVQCRSIYKQGKSEAIAKVKEFLETL